jgi:hypothetical protein
MVRNVGGRRGVLLRDAGESGLIELFRQEDGGVARPRDLPNGDAVAGIRVRRADGSWIEGAALPSAFGHFPPSRRRTR